MEEDFSRIVQPKTVKRFKKKHYFSGIWLNICFKGKRFKKNIILVEYDLIFVLKEGTWTYQMEDNL